MNKHQRHEFDEQLDRVVVRLPQSVLDLLETVPLIVDDQPSRKTMQEVGVQDPRELCGLYTGVPLSERSVTASGQMPDKISIFRLGITHLARAIAGQDDGELRRQIRLTILHEVGHHFGMTEEDLVEIGYG